jgi:hypothetical protein
MRSERRASPRIAKPIRVLVYDPEDALQQPYVGWVVDRSQGGVRLTFRRAGLKKGDIFLIRPASSTANQWVGVKVKNGRWTDNSLEVGCRFVRPTGDLMLQPPADSRSSRLPAE